MDMVVGVLVTLLGSALGVVGSWLEEPFKAARAAARDAGPTLTPAWHKAFGDTLRDRLAAVKDEVKRKLHED